MALLFQIVGYSLHQLISVLEEKECTSMTPSLGVPSSK